MKYRILFCTGIVVSLLMCGCSSNRYETDAWNVVGKAVGNQKELAHFLEHYKQCGDKERYEAACFLVGNMPGKYSIAADNEVIEDVAVVKADSLIASLEYSFRLREKSAFLREYSFEQFLEYILPYRIAHEPLEYYWKWDCGEHFHPATFRDLKVVADSINASIKLELSPDNYKDLPKSYSTLLRDGYGKCDDRTVLLVMALRAAGIPAAYEFVPYWGSSNNGHSFASVILPDGGIYPLQNTDRKTGDGYLFRKTPKVYRIMYGMQGAVADRETVPELFRCGDIRDVTELHRIGFRDVDSQRGSDTNGPHYLSIFSPNGWIPVAESATLCFATVGTGTKKQKTDDVEALDLGDGIVYLPSFWHNGEVLPAGNLLIVSDDSIREIRPDTASCESVVLTRKYPLNSRIVNFAKLMLLGVFEGANKADFSDAEELLSIVVVPESKMQRVRIETGKAYRYVRYHRPNGTFSIAEFKLYDTDGGELAFRPMVCESVEDEEVVKNIYDSDPLTYCELGKVFGMWAGADLYRPRRIDYIGFAPRNDDNAVFPGNLYELFYWRNGWNSLGRQIADADSLVYGNVPKGALLWLRNLTKGREERPFTYQNGKQIWW